MSKEKLLSILERLTECIDGPWFVGDGALLGIHREGCLIEGDDDIDLFLLPGSKLNYKKLNVLGLEAENYYLNEKVYDITYEHIKRNPWLEYINAMRLVNAGLNRIDLIALCSMSYESNKIQNEHTTPNIDVFYLKELTDLDLFILKHEELVYTMERDIIREGENEIHCFYYSGELK